MSRLLSAERRPSGWADARRERLRRLLATLESQRFFPGAHAAAEGSPGVRVRYAAARPSSVPRAPAAMIELAQRHAADRAGARRPYREDAHDAAVRCLGPGNLDTGELAQFPCYLVCVTSATPRRRLGRSAGCAGRGPAAESPGADRRHTRAPGIRRPAGAHGLRRSSWQRGLAPEAFVVQSTSSDLSAPDRSCAR